MTTHGVSADRRVLVQGRILEALPTDDAVLTGTLERLAERFGLSPDDLRSCLRELVRAGWIAVRTEPFQRLTVRLDRRTGAVPRVANERRRSVPDSWSL
jgi:DNA-binding transcriptional regulator PaaX